MRSGRNLGGSNAGRPNGRVGDSMTGGCIPGLKGDASLRREVKYGENARIDIWLEQDPPGDGKKYYVGVKSVTMKRDLGPGKPVEFPDAVTVRGAKHLVELANMVRQGHRAVMMYLVQRADSPWFAIAADIDPVYAKGLEVARGTGVEILCYGCRLTKRDIKVTGPVPFHVPLAF